MGTPAASTANDQSMASNRTSFRAALGFVAGLVATLVVGVAQAASTYAFITGPAPSGGADPVAAEFKSFLDGRGYTTELISMADVASTDFSAYRKVLIGDNTGYLDVWGTATLASYVNSYGKPIGVLAKGATHFSAGLRPIWAGQMAGTARKIPGSSLIPRTRFLSCPTASH
jgi:hypothetical protein